MILYGIPNCDTVRRARGWLDERGVAYAFHDYKKAGADPSKLATWSEQVGWEALLNRRGTTFRRLDPAAREGLDEGKALLLMAEQPSLIRRPVLELDAGRGSGLLVGFDVEEWERELE